MNLIKSCMIALSMYSKIPVPQFEWKEENMRYSLLFFPVVGLVIGVLEIVWFFLGKWFGFPVGFEAAFAVVIPVFVTGGIHLDGYCDTVDALSSFQSRERRLEILKDSHSGAFAILWTGVYFLLNDGIWYLLGDGKLVLMAGLCYVSSRVWSGLAIMFFPAAKKNGLLVTFANAADRCIVRVGLSLMVLLTSAVQIYLFPVAGAILAVCQVILFFYYKQMSGKKFGGITGDLAGWFLQCCELLSLYVCGLCGCLFG